jgi:hypothetical protein
MTFYLPQISSMHVYRDFEHSKGLERSLHLDWWSTQLLLMQQQDVMPTSQRPF